ncbi:hypothetical protein DP107_08285 [Haloglomus irregulare]|uniref:Uncharacterized protein n=1 Tax=Haloglomus irregulare TaxID=2234134 RepID=A0A554NA34_9EURY|nr:hypothetical protein DP107_08285 [Haloglomus irregulare]
MSCRCVVGIRFTHTLQEDPMASPPMSSRVAGSAELVLPAVADRAGDRPGRRTPPLGPLVDPDPFARPDDGARDLDQGPSGPGSGVRHVLDPESLAGVGACGSHGLRSPPE